MLGSTESLLERPICVQRIFCGLQEPPRALQEAVKRPYRHLLRRCCDSDSVLVPFWSHKGSPGTFKIKEFREMSSEFCDFAFISSSRLRDPIWDPPGLRFGSSLALKMGEICLGNLLGAAKSRSRDLFSGPRAVQERSKRPPRRSKKGPGGLWGPILTPPGRSGTPN